MKSLEKIAAAHRVETDVEPCQHCGAPDPYGDHYDAWSDWGDGSGPDGWSCDEVPGAFERWDAWSERNRLMPSAELPPAVAAYVNRGWPPGWTPFVRQVCACGRELEWGGNRWGCGACE